MNDELKYWALALLLIAAALFGFMYYNHVPSTAQTETVVVETCKACGSPVYTEELDYFMPMWVGDIMIMIPVYKTVIHCCKTK